MHLWHHGVILDVSAAAEHHRNNVPIERVETRFTLSSESIAEITSLVKDIGWDKAFVNFVIKRDFIRFAAKEMTNVCWIKWENETICKVVGCWEVEGKSSCESKLMQPNYFDVGCRRTHPFDPRVMVITTCWQGFYSDYACLIVSSNLKMIERVLTLRYSLTSVNPSTT